jgi:hypothetical protein
MVRKGDDLVRGHVICSILGSARVEQEAQNRSRQLSEPEGWVGRRCLIGGEDMYGIDSLADCDLVCGTGERD